MYGKGICLSQLTAVLASVNTPNHFLVCVIDLCAEMVAILILHPGHPIIAIGINNFFIVIIL